MEFDGSKIRQLREAAGMTQEDLGVIAGSTQKKMTFIENELQATTFDVITRIADHFGVMIDELRKDVI